MGAVLLVRASAAYAAGATAPDVASAAMRQAGVGDVLLLFIVVGAVAAAAVLALRAWSEGHYEPDTEDNGLPPLVFPSMPAPPRRREAARPDASSAKVGAQPEPRRRPAPASRQRAASAAAVMPATPVPVPASNGEEVRGDATLQILPGRLEVLGGDAGHEEIRFVRGVGGEAVITLGRGSGRSPEHVQLRSPAVSRLHARMRFAEGRWFLENLSKTNPAVVNGRPLDASSGERLLRDGDQLELGDVVLRFHA